MSRSLKKGPYIAAHLIKKVVSWDNKKTIKTWSRRSVVSPEMISKTIEVHNWKSFIPVFITENHVWHKLWEFAPTRLFRWHKKG
ncbi:MAG: 30S ribosomal protein S19 [Mycoplasmataceae bacterium]|nr:30S ribosomal protein S19 [Mycoplasmataceae bacterium]